jgi:hypothetical protein
MLTEYVVVFSLVPLYCVPEYDQEAETQRSV